MCPVPPLRITSYVTVVYIVSGLQAQQDGKVGNLL